MGHGGHGGSPGEQVAGARKKMSSDRFEKDRHGAGHYPYHHTQNPMMKQSSTTSGPNGAAPGNADKIHAGSNGQK